MYNGSKIDNYRQNVGKMFVRLALALLISVLSSGLAMSGEMPDLYFVDAHSQMARGLDESKIIPLMDKAGVWHTILSARNDRSPSDVAKFARKHPDRITAAVRTKGRAFNRNSPRFRKFIKSQKRNKIFKAMAEVILYHAKKGKKAPLISVSADSPQNKMLLKLAVKKGWPYIAHYEFSASGWDKQGYMDDFESMVRKYPKHPFVLIHMGQLGPEEARRLIETHGNVYFMMSHSNPISVAKNKNQPFVNLFEGGRLAPKWEALALKYPDRFILAFDNVWPEFWGNFYLGQAKIWRKALSQLPPRVGHALAHGNAERLWNLKPRKS